MKQLPDEIHYRYIPRTLLRRLRQLPALFAAILLGGCSRIILFDPKGPIGDTERLVIIVAFVLMLIVVIPVIIMALWFPQKYHTDKTNSHYSPQWSYSGKIETVIWLVPAAIVACLSVLIWNTTHSLDPFKPIESAAKPVNIEVVSLDWKWLFIYPDEDIAVVNQLVFPANVPLSFTITSDTVMTSFFIPQLGSQIYAMAGMKTRLHLLADEPGTFAGQNQQFSGSGYPDMKFAAIAVSFDQFEAWIHEIRQSPEKLDLAGYRKLAQPTHDNPVQYFSSFSPGLFDYVVDRYTTSSDRAADAGGQILR